MRQLKITKSITNRESASLDKYLQETGLEPSTSEAFRTIQSGGARINGEQITDKKYSVTEKDFEDGALILQKGKKKIIKIEMV